MARDLPLNQLGIHELLRGLEAQAFSPVDVVRACLGRIAERDDEIRAWTSVAGDAALAEAERAGVGEALLLGIPFGAKDVLDTGNLPTEMGSRLYAGHRPRYDAGVVAHLRNAGAILLGKTATCEFAGVEPTDTANPLDPSRTPGGSSSGSAAAVADFMAPLALGTQTAGSVLRPAAFCGVVGFKPTYGFYSIAGMKPAAPSFDTVGLITRSVTDAAIVHAVLMADRRPPASPSAPRIGRFRSHLDATVSPEAAKALDAALAALEARGARVVDVAAPEGFEAITAQRALINAFERCRGLASEWRSDRDSLGEKTRRIASAGLAIDGASYVAARREVEAFRRRIDELGGAWDVLVSVTAPAVAPVSRAETGDPRLQEIWTMLHMPSLSLPLPREAGALPIGLQLVGARFEDMPLLAAAAWVERALGAASR